MVQMPSGLRLLRGCSTESLPRIGRQHLMLLKYTQAAATFTIVSAYELSGDQVYLLDAVTRTSTGFNLEQYAGTQATFLAKVASAVSSAQK